MPKPTQAEVADLVGRLHRDADRIWDDEKLGAPAAPDSFEEYLTACLEREAANAIEALLQERAEVHIDYPILASTTQEAMGAAPLAKPAWELPVLSVDELMKRIDEYVRLAWRASRSHAASSAKVADDARDDLRAYALRALRERA